MWMFPVARPRLAVALSLVVCLICGLGLPRLSINADTRVFFSSDNANRALMDAFDARYEPSATLLIALHAAEGTVFTRERLEVIAALTEAAWRLPHATRVQSVTNAVQVTSDSDGIVITDMYAAGSGADPAAVGQRMRDDPLLLNRLIAADGKTAALIVTFDYPRSSSTITSEIIAATREMVAQSQAAATGLEAWYSGLIAASQAFSQASKSDLMTLVPASFGLIFVLLVVITRTWRGAGALFLTAVLTAAATMGIAGWAGIQINAATSNIPTIVIALAVAALIHLLMSSRRFLRAGDTREAAVGKALARDLVPIVLTLVTTSVGFFSLTTADAPPFRELGLLVASGALVALFLGLVLLPALLVLVRLPAGRSQAFVATLVGRTGDIILRRWRMLLLGIPAVSLAAALGIGQIVINDRFPSYFHPSAAYPHDTSLIETHLTGLETVEFDIAGTGAGPGAIFAPDYVRTLGRFEAWLREQPKVASVSSILEIFRRINQHMTDGRPESRVVPEDRQMLAQYLLLYQLSLPPGLSLTNTVTVDENRSRVSVVLRGATSRDLRDLRERGEAWLAAQPGQPVSGVGTGISVMFSYLTSLNVQSMIGGTLIALLIISCIMTGAFRSLRYGLVSLVPNLLPGVVAFGLWGYLFGDVGVAASAAGAVALGIIVDNTVHLILRYQQARSRGADPEQAVREMLRTVGEPMLTSSLVLVAGFSLLSLSGFYVTSTLGILTATTIAAGLLADWFLLPPLLIAVDTALARLARGLAGAADLPARLAAIGANWPQAAPLPDLSRAIGTGADVPQIIAALHHPDDAVRTGAARVLGELRDRRAVPALMGLLAAAGLDLAGPQRPDVAAMAEALRRFGDPEAEALLCRLAAAPPG